MTNTGKRVIGASAISSLRGKPHRRAQPGSYGIALHAKLMTVSSTFVLGGLMLAPMPAHAETISFDEMLRGTRITEQQCAAKPGTVWVTPFGQGICMRYYLSDAGGRGTHAVVYVPGDKPGIVPGSSMYGDPRTAKDSDTNKLLRHAQKISQTTKMPAIHLARMGVDGSSGSHRNRKTQLELQATNLALDAIKRRYRFQTFEIFGNSGGSTVIAGLLAVRNDIGCAVLGSGQLSGHRDHPGVPPQEQPIRPLDASRNSSARIIVVTDPDDQVVERQKQDVFVQRLMGTGRPVEQFYVTAVGDRHHNTSLHSLFVMGQCLHNRSNQGIAEGLRTFEHARGSNAIESIEHEDGERPGSAADPICVQGSWAQAQAGSATQYVCMFWYFEGRLYAPTEMAELAARRSQPR
jgi:hypothetical protein